MAKRAVSECPLPNVHCSYPACVTSGDCVEDRAPYIGSRKMPETPPLVQYAAPDRFEALYLNLRQKIEDLVFPPSDPRRGARTEAELLSELKRRCVQNPVGKR